MKRFTFSLAIACIALSSYGAVDMGDNIIFRLLDDIETNMVILGILLVFLVVVGAFLWRSVCLAKSLKKANEALKKERDNLTLAKQELQDAQNKVERASQLKLAFLRNLSEEVNMPMHTIKEYTSLILECCDLDKHPYLAKYAEHVERSTDILSVILNDLQSLYEIDYGQINLNFRHVSVRSLCQMAIDNLKHKVSNNNVVLRFVPQSEDVKIYTDASRVVQILWQLLSNAIKFTAKGKIMLDCELDRQNKRVLISVTDTGIGIRAENAEKIFDRYYKLDSSQQGAGIGLTLSRHLARLLGGDIRLDTSYASGARFVFWLPLDA